MTDISPALSLAGRYGDDAPAAGDAWNDVLAGLLAHKSVRAYRPDPLPSGTLEALVAAGQSAASSSNLQLWSVVAVEDAGRKQRLSMLAGDQAHIRDAPLFLVWLIDLARAGRITDHAGAAQETLEYIETFLVAAIDAALAAQNATVAAESLGLGTVYIGALRNKPQEVAAELGLPPYVAPVFGMCVGWPDLARPASVKPRLGQPAVLHRETYDPAQQDASVTRYDETLRGFQTGQGMAPVGWSQSIVNRVSNIRALDGRERLREALESFGFKLR